MTVMRTDAFTASHIVQKVTDALLLLAILLPLALLLTLFLTFSTLSSARADDGASCRGTDLLQELKQNDPPAYQAIVDKGDAVPNGKGLLWKIEKPGLEPSWLLGTMHVTDPRVLVMPAGAKSAFDKSATVVIESDEILDEKKAAASILMKPELSMFTNGKTISDFLDNNETAELKAGLAERGIPLEAVSRMQPWMIASFVAMPACELARKAQGASFLDKKIAEDAIADGKQVKGLETLVEQLTAMSELPTSFHLQALIETLALGDKMQDVMYTMTELYLSGDIGMTMPMLEATAPTGEKDDSAYADFEKRIITDRNHVMADRSTPILEEGNVFIAVGALHLPGDEGLVELLRDKGFKVTAVTQ